MCFRTEVSEKQRAYIFFMTITRVYFQKMFNKYSKETMFFWINIKSQSEMIQYFFLFCYCHFWLL